MQQSQVFKSYPLAIISLLSLIIYFSCSKSDQSSTPVTPVKPVDGYFKTSDSTDAAVTSIAGALDKLKYLKIKGVTLSKTLFK